MFSKIEVNGDGKDPLYAELEETADAEGHTGDIRWNFEKFLISPKGEVVARFNPMVDPEAPELIEAIEAQLPS
jgi:glutathione peroxidase